VVATPDRPARIGELGALRPATVRLAGRLVPANGLAAMPAASWAKRAGRVREFALAVFRGEFTPGAEIADPAVLSECAREQGSLQRVA
jgi:predicted DsbA family dithiol-disulfide isomerase